MRVALFGLSLLGLLTIIVIGAPSPDPCSLIDDDDDGGKESECEQTEYHEYTKCMERLKEKRAKRQKRQAACPYAQPQIISPEFSTCQLEYNQCFVGCQGDTLCQNGCPMCDNQPQIGYNQLPCPLEYNNCISNCLEGPSCQIGCQNLCPPPMIPGGYRQVFVEGQNGEIAGQFQTRLEAGHNVTTVIKLNNYINNTNVVNVPTNINSTNVNNIHIYTNRSDDGGKYGLGYSDKGSCCFAVRPKTCHTSSNGIRCHHRRHKTCGQQCTSRTIHVQSRKRCHETGACHRRVAYVPQPRRPKCVYIDQWPHVYCGNYRQSSCEGCYDHYGYGYYNYHGDYSHDCHGCYDDGFDYGPMYRRGPVLRPSYYHEPPCYVTGSCRYNYDDDDCGYGCFGHEYIDPAWGYDYGGRYPPQWPDRHPDEPYYPEEETYSGNYFPSDIDDMKVNETEFNEADWSIPIQKCKVISDDNTVTIRNCTIEDLDQNPYAAAPATFPYYPPYEERRNRRPLPMVSYRSQYDDEPELPIKRRHSQYYDQYVPVDREFYPEDDMDDNILSNEIPS